MWTQNLGKQSCFAQKLFIYYKLSISYLIHHYYKSKNKVFQNSLKLANKCKSDLSNEKEAMVLMYNSMFKKPQDFTLSRLFSREEYIYKWSYVGNPDYTYCCFYFVKCCITGIYLEVVLILSTVQEWLDSFWIYISAMFLRYLKNLRYLTVNITSRSQSFFKDFDLYF